ncbi:MAG: CsbD family protein [Chloroflexi bacterium]|uniref:CsbD family protein n=1 Tax=Candidatus Chlorohelix allophototropha TaxID=3003348 RepID=A0A8T7M352_9CHLR|nr:CsbD family protein [Chloroflexota bacterium]WJW67876.1 CsbD family protein [Chloroflexota bacterium L227-S17]
MKDGKNDRARGKAKEIGGNVQRKLGEVLSDDELKAKGEANIDKGKTQNAVGKVKDAVKDVGDAVKEKVDDITNHKHTHKN